MPTSSQGRSRAPDPPPAFEAAAWTGIEGQWEPLFAAFHEVGFSFEWHDFTTGPRDHPWDPSFHPDSLELCLNRGGEGVLHCAGQEVRVGPDSWVVYRPAAQRLRALRKAGQRHQFITLELTREFVAGHLPPPLDTVAPLIRGWLERSGEEARIGAVERLDPARLELIRQLRTPPVPAAARRTWYEARALDLMVGFAFVAPREELFCERQLRLQRDRVAEVMAILKRQLADPPGLEALAREVGVSPFYLSRIFSRTMGIPLNQYLRRLRLERAAELLRSGEYNVTEAAYEVGYNSLSHFSAAFHQQFGICPGLYPIAAAQGKLPARS